MKSQIITIGLLLAALNFTSCKNSETTAPETPVTSANPALVDTTMQKPETTVKDSVKPTDKEENESDEKNEKE